MRCLPFLSLFEMANKEKPKGQRQGRCPLGCAARACSVCGACAHQAGRGGFAAGHMGPRAGRRFP